MRGSSRQAANGSKGDIRGYVKWRKISGGTRGDLGIRCCGGVAGLNEDPPQALCLSLGLPGRRDPDSTPVRCSP
jgi:hypothetical protein